MAGDRVPWMDPVVLCQRVLQFRQLHHADDIPVPIERIVEVDFGLHIVPVTDLRSLAGTRGYLTSDCSTIMVDRYFYDHDEHTYRYTLAHELSHIELHRDLWSALNITSTDEYLEAMESLLSEAEYDHLEWQANNFAGRVLVPEKHLRSQFSPHVGWACDRVQRGVPSNADRQALYDIALQTIADRLTPVFGVHRLPLGIRIAEEGLGAELARRLPGGGEGVNLRYRDR
jgi:hypothetical protein